MKYIDIRATSQKWNMPERKITAFCRDGRIPGAVKNRNLWQIPENAAIPLDARTKAYSASLRMGDDSQNSFLSDPGHDLCCDAVLRFEQIYKTAPAHTGFTPYRVCPLGAHSDHQLGKITGFAINKGIFIAYCPKENGIVELCSLQFSKQTQWHVLSTPEKKQNDWADYLRGATIALAARYPLHIGLCGVITGELPIGGLSSSAAVIITFLSALCRVNGITLSPQEMILLSKEAENQYVGVSCGKLDQSCEVYCRKDKLLYLDTLDDSYELIPQNPGMKPYELVIFFSGVERSLIGSKYNTRVDECRAAAYSLMAFAGLEYGKIGEACLRKIPYDAFLSYRDRLPECFARRADHFFSEFIRVEAGSEAWRKGNMDEFGRLCFESGYSSIHSYETGSSELIRLYEIMRQTDGIYGGRFSGAGFKGCCIALIDPAYEEQILQRVETEYLKTFPALRGRYSAHICRTADGVIL